MGYKITLCSKSALRRWSGVLLRALRKNAVRADDGLSPTLLLRRKTAFLAKGWGTLEYSREEPRKAGPPAQLELGGDQLGELGRDLCHRIFCSTQAASRAEQGTDFAESFVCRVVHDGNEQVTC